MEPGNPKITKNSVDSATHTGKRQNFADSANFSKKHTNSQNLKAHFR
ncbi:hypothetical protein [Helicobacter sp. 23-1045]